VIKEETPLAQITPYQAYVFSLKHYIDTFYTDKPLEKAKLILEDKGYKVYRYQIDAVSQALQIINDHNGVIIADVVGLGKSIVASTLAFVLGEKGIVISPPGLIENWEEYLEDFGLNRLGWKAYSVGKLEDILQTVNKDPEIKVVIVDEAHRFRNEATRSYDLLSKITKGKKVILLTATPFNNRPSDVFSLIKLFQIPKKSTLTLDGKAAYRFKDYENEFSDLVYIKTNYKKKKDKAKKLYKEIFGYETIDLKEVERRLKKLSKEIKNFIQPVMIRRNRLDLKNNPIYSKEIKDLPKVEDPIEVFYELNKKQSEFYDKVITKYFGEKGEFTGAIYVPYRYKEGFREQEEEKEDFIAISQENLRNFMKRLLVKRFESSFGAFKQSIENFLKVYEKAKKFIERTGFYILDRKLLDLSQEMNDDELLEELIKRLETLENQSKDIQKIKLSKDYYVYDLMEFEEKEKFLKDIDKDIELFKKILQEMEKLKLLEEDPKAEALIKYIEETLNKKENPKRKIIIFSEYRDTVKYLKEKLKKFRVLTVEGHISHNLIKTIKKNFDASLDKEDWEDDYDILLATDRISEGFNLARAGVVINYDIPWNPVRVIQRLGRINRIGQKVFDNLYIVNFFPTEKGEEHTRQKEIAQNKLLLIHNSIGEDAKIFSPDEEPTASELYRRLTTNPDEMEEESFLTKVIREFQEIKEKDPEVIKQIENLPYRLKVSKQGDNDELIVLIRKNNNLFIGYKDYSENRPKVVSFEDIYEKIKANKNEKPLEKSDKFWSAYQEIKDYETKKNHRKVNPKDYENQAINTLETLREKITDQDLIEVIENLKKAISDYGIIPTYTLKAILELDTNDIEQCKSTLYNIQKELGGKDFLKDLQKKINNTNENIVIAIENIKPL
ncbi:helicase-related protein, partial [Sulfurihydrogenibium sp.]|uniref:helicase-related protein n=1 Tax=Sulfurihydrogenibium sp. TaxID=2053621 RepID=UPI003D0C42C3